MTYKQLFIMLSAVSGKMYASKDSSAYFRMRVYALVIS